MDKDKDKEQGHCRPYIKAQKPELESLLWGVSERFWWRACVSTMVSNMWGAALEWAAYIPNRRPVKSEESSGNWLPDWL